MAEVVVPVIILLGPMGAQAVMVVILVVVVEEVVPPHTVHPTALVVEVVMVAEAKSESGLSKEWVLTMLNSTQVMMKHSKLEMS